MTVAEATPTATGELQCLKTAAYIGPGDDVPYGPRKGLVDGRVDECPSHLIVGSARKGAIVTMRSVRTVKMDRHGFQAMQLCHRLIASCFFVVALGTPDREVGIIQVWA